MTVLGLAPRTGLAMTGLRGWVCSDRVLGPRLALIGELDSLRTSEHPLADPATGAAHSRGDNAHIDGTLGAATAADRRQDCWPTLRRGSSFSRCWPRNRSMSRQRPGCVAKGEIDFSAWQAESVAKGYFDDVDMAMMIHIRAHRRSEAVLGHRRIRRTGPLVKQIRFSRPGGACRRRCRSSASTRSTRR